MQVLFAYISAYGYHRRNVDMEVSLSPGEYFIHVIADWVGPEYDFFLGFYGSVIIDFKKLYTREFPAMIHQSLDKVCVEQGKQNSKGPIN